MATLRQPTATPSKKQHRQREGVDRHAGQAGQRCRPARRPRTTARVREPNAAISFATRGKDTAAPTPAGQQQQPTSAADRLKSVGEGGEPGGPGRRTGSRGNRTARPTDHWRGGNDGRACILGQDEFPIFEGQRPDRRRRPGRTRRRGVTRVGPGRRKPREAQNPRSPPHGDERDPSYPSNRPVAEQMPSQAVFPSPRPRRPASITMSCRCRLVHVTRARLLGRVRSGNASAGRAARADSRRPSAGSSTNDVAGSAPATAAPPGPPEVRSRVRLGLQGDHPTASHSVRSGAPVRARTSGSGQRVEAVETHGRVAGRRRRRRRGSRPDRRRPARPAPAPAVPPPSASSLSQVGPGDHGRTRSARAGWVGNSSRYCIWSISYSPLNSPQLR